MQKSLYKDLPGTVLSVIILTFLCINNSLYCQTKTELSDFIHEKLKSKEFFGAQVGYNIIDIDGEVLVKQNENTGLIPASTMKLVSSLSALEILGPNFQYETKILFQKQSILGNVLDGDIIVIGSGDPSLAGIKDSPAIPLDKIVTTIKSELQAYGITCIDGNLIIDNSLFEEQAVHDSWPWDDLSNYYAAGPQALNFNENQYKLYFNRSEQSDRPTTVHHTEPTIEGLLLISKVTTGPKGSGDNAYIYGAPKSWTKEIKGTIPPGKGYFDIKGALPNPAMQFARTIQTALANEGIQLNDIVVSNQPISSTGHQVLCSIKSKPLRELVKHTNYISNNLYADSFIKKVGSSSGVGSYESGAEAIQNHIGELDIDVRAMQIKDGSGLSSRNRLTPTLLTSLLRKKISHFGIDLIKDILPQAGMSGSVKGLLSKKSSRGKVWLKSGSMGGVQTYAGIIETEAGNTIIISIMSNGHSGGNSKIRRHFADIFDHVYDKF